MPIYQCNKESSRTILQQNNNPDSKNLILYQQQQQLPFIYSLPPECLLDIFKYLPLRDQIKLSTISDYFQDILILYFSTNKSLTVSQHHVQDLGLIEIKENLFNFGKFIEKISLSSIYNFLSIFELLIKYCPNVKYLNLYGIQLDRCESNSFFQLIAVHFSKLKYLELDCCYFYNENLNALHRISTQLENLKLNSLKYFDGNYLHEFSQLRSLSISFCSIKLDNFNKICKSMKNLINLDIIECYIPLFNSKCFENLSMNLKNLQKLSIFLYYNDCNLMDMDKAGFAIGSLKSLKHLIIRGTDMHVVRFLEILALTELKLNLEILELPLYPEQKQLKTLISFKNLRELNFTNIYYTDIYNNNYLILLKLSKTMKTLKMTCTYLTESWDNNGFWDFIRNSQKFEKFQITIRNYGDYNKLKFVKHLLNSLENNSNGNYVNLSIDVTDSEKQEIMQEIGQVSKNLFVNFQFYELEEIEPSEME